jgi:hypothetical protein
VGEGGVRTWGGGFLREGYWPFLFLVSFFLPVVKLFSFNAAMGLVNLFYFFVFLSVRCGRAAPGDSGLGGVVGTCIPDHNTSRVRGKKKKFWRFLAAPLSFVTRAYEVQQQETGDAQAHISIINNSDTTDPKRKFFRAWLDSGCNESMFCEDPGFSKVHHNVKFNIDTANKDSRMGSNKVGEVNFLTEQNIQLPGFEKTIYTPELADNLASVGRIADGGLTIVFNKVGAKIFENKGLKISGKEIHHEFRHKSGLYPIT